VTVLRWLRTSASVTVYLPSAVNRCVNVSPGFRIGEAKEASCETGWRLRLSEFVHVIESPSSIVTALGTKPEFVMLTVFVAASALGATSRNAASSGSKSNLRICLIPLSGLTVL
jgi:hypothetical protein